jgi:hypothetical protein
MITSPKDEAMVRYFDPLVLWVSAWPSQASSKVVLRVAPRGVHRVFAVSRGRQFCTSSKNLHNTIPHGIARQVRNGMETQFAHEVGAVCLSGLDTEVQGHGYFFACPPFG